VLAARAGTREHLAAVAVAALAVAAGPATIAAVHWGHPEEVLTATLATAAVLAARAGRRTAAAVLLGLAIGAKEWAVLLAPAVLVALPAGRGRGRAAAGALALALLTTLPLPLLDPAAFHRADATVGAIAGVVPLDLWWPVTLLVHRLPLGLHRPEAAGLGMLALGAVVVAAGRWRRRRRPVAAVDPLALLALLGLLRCLVDPAALGYYLVAAALPLAVWEADVRRRLPVLSLAGAAVQAICASDVLGLDGRAGTDLRFGVFLAAAVLLAGVLVARSFPWAEREPPVDRASPPGVPHSGAPPAATAELVGTA
jgi:hypothetical protein